LTIIFWLVEVSLMRRLPQLPGAREGYFNVNSLRVRIGAKLRGQSVRRATGLPGCNRL